MPRLESGHVFDTLVVGEVVFQLQNHSRFDAVILVKEGEDVALYAYVVGYVEGQFDDQGILRWAAENFIVEDMDYLLSFRGAPYRVLAERFPRRPEDMW